MGVSHLLEHMVFKGTERRSAREIALALEALGGSLDAYTAREHTAYQARALDANLREAADVLADLVYRPLLRATDLKLERQVVLEEISMVQDTPDDLVFELHNEALWRGHPYGYSILGTRDSVSRLGVSDLRALHDRAYHPAQTIVAAAGNVDARSPAGGPARHGLGRSAREEPSRRRGGRRRVATPPSARHVVREGAQTHIVFGSPAVSHGDPRRYTLALVSTVSRRRHELSLVSARARGARPRLRRVYFPVVPCRYRDARRVCRDRPGAAREAVAAIQRSWRGWRPTGSRPRSSNRGRTSSQGKSPSLWRV